MQAVSCAQSCGSDKMDTRGQDIHRQTTRFELICSSAAAFIRVLSALFFLVLVDGQALAVEQSYKLGPHDRLRLRAYEWRPSIDTIHEWKALNDEFTIGASGTLSLPLLGEIAAAGLTPESFGRLIAQRLRAYMRLAVLPKIAVEVVRYRPFYVVGSVDRPGEYEFRPGLTVLKAMSIAGGLKRTKDTDLIRLGREAITTRSNLQVLALQVNNLVARKARLIAELMNEDSVTFPPELTKRKSDSSINLLIVQEKQIFEARRNALKTQLEVLEQLKSYLEREVVSLHAQVKTHKKERRLVQRELKKISTLVKRGLSVSQRRLGLQRTAAQLERDGLRLETNLLKVRQNISRTEISLLEARNSRKRDVTLSLRKVQSDLEQTIRRYEAAQKLLYDTQISVPQILAHRRQSRETKPVYTLVTHVDETRKELAVADSALVNPGDTVKVEFLEPEGLLPASILESAVSQ